MRLLRAWALAWLLAAALSALLTQGIPAQGGELLDNGDFNDEEGTDPWRAFGGELTTSLPGEGRNDSTAGVFTADHLPTHWVNQCVPAWEGGEYEFTAYLMVPSKVSVTLKTVWYSQDGCQGEQVDLPAPVDWPELGPLPLEDGGPWHYLEAGPLPGVLGSRSARLNVFFDFSGDGEAIVYLDDFSFQGPAAPSPTPTPTPSLPSTLSPTPTPSLPPTLGPTPTPTLAPTLGPTPTPSLPPTLSPTPTPTLPPGSTTTPTGTATPKPAASPAPSPRSTPRPTGTATPPKPSPSPVSGGGGPSSPPIRFGLTNGGFEELDGEDGLLAWRKYGGELTRSAQASQEGGFSAAFRSRTESTKWVFQTLRVEGGRAYDLTGYALKNDANVQAAYLRLSWYASADGSGRTMGSVDSTSRLTEDSPDFRLLTTGAVLAPAEASSAKVRLMLDPAGEAEAIVYFDAISFVEAEMPSPSPEDTPAPTAAPGDEEPSSPTAVLGEESSPFPTASTSPPSSPVQSGPPTATPSAPTAPGATPLATAADGDGGPNDGVRQVFAGDRHLKGTPGRALVALYRERRASASPQDALSAAEDSAGGTDWPLDYGAAGFAIALGLGSGLFLWQRRRGRARRE